MATKRATFDGGRNDHETEFDAGMTAARDTMLLQVEDSRNLIAPQIEQVDGTMAESIAAIASPWTILLDVVAEEPDADEVDGVKPGHTDPRRAQSFVFDAALPNDEDDEISPTFTVVAVYENQYDDMRVAIETPAPWDMPDSFDGDDPNEVVKSLPWGDEDALQADDYDPDDGAYHTFDADSYKAPDNTWVIDQRAVDELRERATAEGYDWADDTQTATTEDEHEGDSEDDTLDHLTEFAEQGDDIELRYEKKNGNGIGTKTGEVEVAETGEGEYGRTVTQGLVIRRDDGKVNKLRRDDNDDPGAYSNSQYPYMGEPISATVYPDDE